MFSIKKDYKKMLSYILAILACVLVAKMLHVDIDSLFTKIKNWFNV